MLNDAMTTAWLTCNRASRAVGDDWEAVLTAALAAKGWTLAGTTDFPEQPLPSPADLDAAGVAIAVVAAGDGTINALAAVLEDWHGALLVLPGGTMNLLAKALHGDATPQAIIASVATPPATRQLSTVDADGARAVVGAIVGPGATWVHTREAVRKGAWSKLGRAVRLAYVRSLSHAVRTLHHGRRSQGYRAIFVHADDDALSIVKVRASGWSDGVRLGFAYLTGTWSSARGIETERARQITLTASRPIFALFDGEPCRLPAGSTLSLGRTQLQFVTTL